MFLIVFGIGVGLTLIYANNKYKVYGEEEPKQIKKHINAISMMLETEAGSGNYEMTTSDSWPTEGYVFNSTLSKCENGGELSWDDTNKTVIMSGNISDKCYVYFDIKTKVLLADYVKSLYTGTQGENNIYYHDSSLENGAGDNSYRYAGSSDTTNNYVCFGSTESPCPEDNLYRIIGVFDGQVKLIKATKATSSLLGTDGGYVSDADYNWSDLDKCPSETTSYIQDRNLIRMANKKIIAVETGPDEPVTDDSGCNKWKYSELHTINLNTNYLNNIGTIWTNMIEDTIWKISGHTTSSVTPSEMYSSEITNATTSDKTSKVGLMYASDYGFAAAPNSWTITLSSYSNSSITTVNWMYIRLTEWTITRDSSSSGFVFRLSDNGYLSHRNSAYRGIGARPVFYLKSSVAYVSGDGTQNLPFRIEN